MFDSVSVCLSACLSVCLPVWLFVSEQILVGSSQQFYQRCVLGQEKYKHILEVTHAILLIVYDWKRPDLLAAEVFGGLRLFIVDDVTV